VGGGGHASELLRHLGPQGGLIGWDWDPEMLARARSVLHDRRVSLVRGNFGVLCGALKSPVSGILADLGFALDQMFSADRGLSFDVSGPLDMRLDPDGRETLRDLLEKVDVRGLTDILNRFGGVRRAHHVAGRILERFHQGLLRTTKDLSHLCGARRGRRHPATTVFQALRIAVNREMENLQGLLEGSPRILRRGGRLVVISFHSLEDRQVKSAFRKGAGDGVLRVLTRKPIRPGREEQKSNPRARSARLRAAERV